MKRLGLIAAFSLLALTYTPAEAQEFNIVSAPTQKCLDIPNGTAADNAPVNQFTCDGSEEQKFRLLQLNDGTVSVVAKHSNKCLDVPNADPADNLQILQWTCDGSVQQGFLFLEQ